MLSHPTHDSLDAAAGLACKGRTLRQSSQDRILLDAGLLEMPSKPVSPARNTLLLQVLQRHRSKTSIAHGADGLGQGVGAGKRRHVADAVAHGRASQVIAVTARLLTEGNVHEQADLAVGDHVAYVGAGFLHLARYLDIESVGPQQSSRPSG